MTTPRQRRHQLLARVLLEQLQGAKSQARLETLARRERILMDALAEDRRLVDRERQRRWREARRSEARRSS